MHCTVDEAPQSADFTVDALTSLLIPVESSPSGKVSRKLLAQFLELDDASSASSGPPQYSTQTQIADATGKQREQIGQILRMVGSTTSDDLSLVNPIV